MSQATKRKHVVKEVLGDYDPPSEIQQIVRVLGSPGNNLHEVETAQGERFLASMPTKFRKNIWIKRGDFLIVDPIQEGEKVKAEINSILYKEHIKQLRKDGLCNTKKDGSNRGSEEESGDDSEDDSDLFVNTNRRNYEYSESEDEEEDEEEQGV
ncbi:probable RNA-binding protein EIF1AD isoform X2 [Rhincodon typus]|uniref:probable RNA-binding protein EIF1AD isoform X2 n=1 Tax=Rhincodon typus TaxID=259920 RepID=UPI00202E7B64|nr:probable RNA-binding protein EIF1AD isoform X2 [Rhincodon typus]XP_048477320.1 probable RNA-binding protein EIF1AD isoform X2 [Rhincodon typus]XP_048477321.1 probable RNA-binding protein EIF1AD isoform X2 [Rhincodon typus]